jgi:PhnB protein
MAVKPKPDGYSTIAPYLFIKGADRFIDFLGRAFGGQAAEAMRTPTGEIAHGEVRIGDSVIMLSEAPAFRQATSPVHLHVYVEDVDSVFRQAVEAGATPETQPTDQFYGDRSGTLKDEWGNTWYVATHIEDLSIEEMQKRAAEARP